MFKLNLKIALRSLWKNLAFTLINTGGLALGLASCMILLLYVAYEWGYDRQSPNYQDTYMLYNHQHSSGGIASHGWTPGVTATVLKDELPGVVRASHSSYPEQQLISYGTKIFRKDAVYADPAFVKILDYHFISGNPDRALQQINTIILTASMAKALFGDQDPLNKVVRLNNQESLKVEGVIADIAQNSSIQFDLLMPWELWIAHHPGMEAKRWDNNFCLTLVQLQNKQAFAKADQLTRTLYQKHQGDGISHYSLHPMQRWHLYGDFQNGRSVGGKIDQVRIFFMLAFCILLIACVNFMNLSTARSEKRAKEVGVRKAIGSSRGALIVQFILESAVLAFSGMVVAFVLIELSLPYFNQLLQTRLTIVYADWKFWLTFIALTLSTGVIAGSYPAFYLSSFEPLQVLKGLKMASGKSLSVRKVLVVFQFVFAACLIICTAVIYQQLRYIQNKPIGYNKQNLVEVTLEGPLLRSESRLNTLRERVLRSGASSHVTFFSRSLSEGGNSTFGVEWPGKEEKTQILFNQRSAGYDFVRTIGAEMQSGREFLPQYADSSKIMVNESAVRAMGLKHPLGTVIEFWGMPVTIIGVMKDFVMESAYARPAPMLIYRNMSRMDMMVVRLEGKESLHAAVARLTGIVQEINPGFPVRLKFADENFDAKLQNEKLLGTVANLFGGFAIFISCLGLLGLALYMAEQRKKEISIRKVLGASSINIVVLLNKDFIRLVIIANLIAFPIAFIIANKWLSAYTYRVMITMLPFVLALGLSLIIAILTVSIQSVKVVKANPADALKYE